MKQDLALSYLKSGKNIFLTGSAGTGKTWVLNQYIQYLKDRKVAVAITASTGIAATHLSGMTIHSWAGMGIKDELTDMELQGLYGKKYLREKMKQVRVLIIDEISMLHRRQLALLNRILRFFKNSNQAFGGVQLILCGDFFQLPPIGEGAMRERFAFMAKAWVDAGLTICYLTQQYRQSDQHLNAILNKIRSRTVDQQALDLLGQTANQRFQQVKAPMLYTHNADVDRMNLEQLTQLTKPARLFTATTKGNTKLVDGLKKSVRTSENLALKEGARVMFVKNNPEKGYFNGSLAEVVKFNASGNPVVKLSSGRILEVEEEEWRVEDEQGKALAKFIQLPLRLAWAITIHKSQGMTLEAAEINLEKTFEAGQGYVALSRVKSLEGLRLKGFNALALKVDDLAWKADCRFQELSQEAERAAEFINFAEVQLSFIKSCGGVTDPKQVERERKKAKQKGLKIHTVDVTKSLVEEGKNLAEIIEERGLTESTIINHLVKIKDKNKEVNLEQFRPDATLLQRIRLAKIAIINAGLEGTYKEDGSVSRKALFEQMNQEVGYSEISLALLFI